MTAENYARSAAKARATRSAKPCKDGQARQANGRCPPKPCRNNLARNASGRCPPISQGERTAILAGARVAKVQKRQALIAQGIHPTQVAPCRPSYGGKPRVRMATGKIDPKTGRETYACKVLKGSKRGNIGATHWPRPNTARYSPSPSTSTVTASAGPSIPSNLVPAGFTADGTPKFFFKTKAGAQSKQARTLEAIMKMRA